MRLDGLFLSSDELKGEPVRCVGIVTLSFRCVVLVSEKSKLVNPGALKALRPSLRGCALMQSPALSTVHGAANAASFSRFRPPDSSPCIFWPVAKERTSGVS
jgi:hypothetical protein